MKISLNMIVKDDSEIGILRNCLASIVPYVDYVCLTATGKKVSKIEALCRQKGYRYSYFKWVGDFSKARNFNFSQAPKGTDYILWLDADDIFVGGKELREVATEAKKRGKDVVFFTYWYGCTFKGKPTYKNMISVDMQHLRERLIRPGVCVWKNRLHETPVPVDGRNNINTNYSYNPKENRNIAVMHTEDGSRLAEKQERNRVLLETQLEEEKKRKQGADPRTLLYLMKIYAEQDIRANWIKSLDMGKEYLKKSGWDEEIGVCWEQMGICYGRLNDYGRAVGCFHSAIQAWPYQPLFYIRLATAYYNLKRYLEAKHWLEIGMGIEINDFSGNMINYKMMKVMAMDLKTKLAYNVAKDPDEAVRSAEMLLKEDPTTQHKEELLFLYDMKDFNDNCKRLDNFLKYLEDIGEAKSIIKIVDVLPDKLAQQPFVISHIKKQIKPRTWKKNEICYFANFGGKHFEKWDENSLKTGIGGSETAVIRLSEEWAKLGWEVTVYGDPKTKHTTNGVRWMPWYYFNPKDKFNIFIQWRNPGMAGQIKCKKFFVDLHDIFSNLDYTPKLLKHITGVNVKSKYHRELAPNIKNINIISNGV